MSRGRPRTKSPDDATLRALYESGWTLQQIADHYGVRNRCTVRTHLMKSGVTMRKRGGWFPRRPIAGLDAPESAASCALPPVCG